MGMEISLIQAGSGDCILVRCGREMKKVNILIDSGIKKDYFIKALDRILENEEKIDMLVLTHDDNDHIQGACKLLEQLNREEKRSKISGRIIGIDQKTNAGYRELLKNLTSDKILFNYGGNGLDVQLSAKEAKKLFENYRENDIRQLGFLLADAEGAPDVPHPNMLQLRWKNSRDGMVSKIVRQPNREELEIEEEHLEIVILSPERKALEDYIRHAWKTLERSDISLKSEKREKRVDEWERSIQYWMLHNLDTNRKLTKANTASIAFLLIYEGGYGVFAGDAAPDAMVNAGKKYLARKNVSQEYIEVDFIKMPHHGSSNNVSREFLEFYRTKTYFITTDGNNRHQHPGKAALALIASVLEKGETAHIYSSYSWWKKNDKFCEKERNLEKWNEDGDLCTLTDIDGNEKYLHFHKTGTDPIVVSKDISVRR